jgi:hypothetical protein
MVYQVSFKRTTTFTPHKPSELPFNGDYTSRFSTILQTSKQVYHEAHPLLYKENSFSIRAGKNCFKPFDHPLLQSKPDTIFQLKDLTVHIVKLSGIKTIWKILCSLKLELLTLDFGRDGEPSIGGGQGTHDPMLAIAQILHLTKIVPETQLPRFSINAEIVARYKSNRSKETGPYQAFARTASDNGTSGRCPTAGQVMLKAGLTASQLGHLSRAASTHVAGWCLKERQDENKDTENKENELEEKTFIWLKQ